MGHSEEIERILDELEQNDGKTIPISESFLFIPNNTIIGLSKSQVDYNLRIGKNCKIIGNYDIKEDIYVDDRSNVYGSLIARGNIFCGKKAKIHGNITATGEITIGSQTHIIGDVTGLKIYLSKTASVQGTLLGKKGISFIDSSEEQAKDKIKRFENDVDVVDEVTEMLE